MSGDPSSTSPPNNLQPGRVLVNRYELIRLAGSGGMAQVWEATDRVLGRRVAIKLLHNHLASASSIARFRQEGVAAAKLIHPNVVGIFDTIPVDNTEALVMEFVEGHTLRAHLDRHRTISEQDTRHIGIAVSEALAAAHNQGLVHRDVKPANILLCKNGQVKITDFGIAKAAESDGLTREGTLVGTAAYLAPEQLDGSPVDGRADLYALGLVLYECLAGRAAFSGDTDAAVALARLRTDATDLASLNPAASPQIVAIIRRAMGRSPNDRFQDAVAFRSALMERATPTNVSAARAANQPRPRPQGPPPRAAEPVTKVHESDDYEDEFESERKPRSRRWMVPAGAGAIVLISLLIAIALIMGSNTSPKPKSDTKVFSNPVELQIVSAETLDPQGDGSERDDLLDQSFDKNLNSNWRTERYDDGALDGANKGKTGVGVAWKLDGTYAVHDVKIDTNSTGWSADIFVTSDVNRETFKAPTTPTGRITDLSTPSTTVDTKNAVGNTVIIWITNLGDLEGPQASVSIAEVTIRGEKP